MDLYDFKEKSGNFVEKADKIKKIHVKSILNKHKKRDSWFLDDYTLNPYYGCSVNCLYCYIRGSKYGGNTTHKTSAKVNAPEILIKQLKKRAKNKEHGLIAIATSSEPYPNIEEELKLTRSILQIIARFKFPVGILTKSTLVLSRINFSNSSSSKISLILPAIYSISLILRVLNLKEE